MSNMSYCRFENTLKDLEDFHEHLSDKDLGEEETMARKQLAELCEQIAEEFFGADT